MTEADIYRILSDIISDSYDWLSNDCHKEYAIQYVLGLNDMARALVDEMRKESERGNQE